MGNCLEIEGLSKSFGSVRALDQIAFSLPRSECLGLLGPNGAGKTTTIRIIGGRLRPDQGCVRFPGADPHVKRCSALGVVPQEIALYPRLTTRENLEIFGELTGLKRAALRTRVGWALGWTGLAEKSDALVQNLSGGMKRRLNLACGVLHQPSIVLMDEPTAGVDPQSRARIWEMVDELKSAGSAVLVSTHQLYEAENICDRVAIINHGKIVAIGTVNQLIEDVLGQGHHVSASIDRPLVMPIAEFDVPADARQISVVVDDLARQLPRLVKEIEEQGCAITGMRVEAPSLEAAFLRLTGRELSDD